MPKELQPILTEFALNLQELTFSSLPIIENLTTIAAENPDIADGIIDLITKRILKCMPEHKLSALHLLDSICKRIGNPYNILVGDEIFDIYSHAFQLVNETVRTKMVELFETWKTTKAKNSTFPLFPRNQLDKIDSFLSKAGYPKRVKGDHLTNKVLIEYINIMVPLFKSKLDTMPSPKLQDQYKALLQLKSHLSNQPLKAAQLQAIHDRLDAVREQELGPDLGVRSPPSVHGNESFKTSGVGSSTDGLFGQVLAVPTKKIDTLFGYLISSGLVSVDQAPIPGSKPVYSCVVPTVKYSPSYAHSASANMLQEALESTPGELRLEYDQLKLSEMILVSKQTLVSLQSFLTDSKPSPEAIQLLYLAKGWKCGQCGKRFGTDLDGARKKTLHLDWHFRINKKLGDPACRVQSRRWFLDDFDWVAFKDENLLEFATTMVSAASDLHAESSREKVASSAFVKVLSSDTNMSNRCIICREHVKATYNDEIGEWCWFGCVLASGEGPQSRKIVHTTCLSETSIKRGSEHDGARE